MSRFQIIACCASLIIGTGSVASIETLPLHSAAINRHNHVGGRTAPALLQVRAGPTTEKVTNACLEAINALRTGSIAGFSSPLEALSLDSQLEGAAETTAKQLAGVDTNCANGASAKSSKENPGILVSFRHGETRKCQDLINVSYLGGMKHLIAQKFNPSASQYDNSPFANVDSANVAYIMSSEPKNVGCAWTTDCAAGANVLFCKVDKALDESKSPFTAEVYAAMVQRYFTTSSASLPATGVAATAVSLLLMMFFVPM